MVGLTKEPHDGTDQEPIVGLTKEPCGWTNEEPMVGPTKEPHGTCSGGEQHPYPSTPCPKAPPAPTIPPQHPCCLQKGGIDRPLGCHLLKGSGDREGGGQDNAGGGGVLPAALFHLRKKLENTQAVI